MPPIQSGRVAFPPKFNLFHRVAKLIDELFNSDCRASVELVEQKIQSVLAILLRQLKLRLVSMANHILVVHHEPLLKSLIAL